MGLPTDPLTKFDLGLVGRVCLDGKGHCAIVGTVNAQGLASFDLKEASSSPCTYSVSSNGVARIETTLDTSLIPVGFMTKTFVARVALVNNEFSYFLVEGCGQLGFNPTTQTCNDPNRIPLVLTGESSEQERLHARVFDDNSHVQGDDSGEGNDNNDNEIESCVGLTFT